MRALLLDVVPWMVDGSARDQGLYVLALGLLVVGTALAALALRVAALDVLAVTVAAAGVTAWLLSSGPAEGPTLVVVLPGNGLTLADLAVLPVLALIAVLTRRRLWGSWHGGGRRVGPDAVRPTRT